MENENEKVEEEEGGGEGRAHGEGGGESVLSGSVCTLHCSRQLRREQGMLSAIDLFMCVP